MYCKNCGSQIADGAKFCSQCGTLVESAPQPAAGMPVGREETSVPYAGASYENNITEEPYEAPRKPVIEDVPWDVGDYPSRDRIEKTEDVNFNWHAKPSDIQDRTPAARVQTPVPADDSILSGADLEKSVFGDMSGNSQDDMSAAERIDKFYTFNKKNEEFQQLLDREYRKVKQGGAIQAELSDAQHRADERFNVRTENSTMEEFLQSEGIEQRYQPKAFESDVLRRIEAQEAEKEAKRLEEEARLAAIEQAKLEAQAKKQKEEEAARLAEIARKQAEEEAIAAEQARIKAREEARARAEEEARLRAEEQARIQAEADARARAEEDARLKAEAELKAQREAAKIKAQQEARLAAEAEARFKAEQEKRQFAEQEARQKLEAEQKRLTEEANQAVAQEEIRRVLEQTARMQKEEEAKIRAAVAGLKAGASAAGTTSTMTPHSEVLEAHKATRNQINEMAKARDEFFAEFENEAQQPATGRNTMLSGENDLTRTRVVDKAAVLSGISEPTQVISRESMRQAEAQAAPDISGTPVQQQGMDSELRSEINEQPQQPANDLEDLLSQFESVSDKTDDDPAATRQMQPVQPVQEQPRVSDDTIVAPHNDRFDNLPDNSFDSYGNEEAAEYINRQHAENEQTQSAADQADGDAYEELSPKEIKRREKEQKKLEKQKAKEAAKAAKHGGAADESGDDDYDDGISGGKGRIVLKIVLVVLIVVLAFELVCIGIRILAPQSKAAEFVDKQINNIVQMISGEDTQLSYAAIQVRTEPKEDKTDLINNQKTRNVNSNIGEITYNADLSYDEERDGKVSDLVLSQPLTQVEWGRDSDNYPVYFDEQVVGEIIEFESARYELMNSGDESVLGMIDKEMKLYKQTAKLKNKKTDGSFTRLEIGEIRQAGSNYYVWVKEVVGDSEKEYVYSMYPEEKYTMKMAARYKV